MAAADPGDPHDPVTWPRWAQLMPHLLVADLAATGNQGLRKMACNACWYLLARGDTRTAYDLAADLRQHWRDRLGDDDETTLAVVGYLAWALRAMGHYAEARELEEDTLARKRRVLGEDHPDILRSAGSLAASPRAGRRRLQRRGDLGAAARGRGAAPSGRWPRHQGPRPRRGHGAAALSSQIGKQARPERLVAVVGAEGRGADDIACRAQPREVRLVVRVL